jgi:hypothetical protein
MLIVNRCQCPRGVRRGSAAARFLGLRVGIPRGGMDACLFAKADHSSREVLPSVICMSVIVKPV